MATISAAVIRCRGQQRRPSRSLLFLLMAVATTRVFGFLPPWSKAAHKPTNASPLHSTTKTQEHWQQRQQQQQEESLFDLFVHENATSSSFSSSLDKQSTGNNHKNHDNHVVWFPRRIQDTLDYESVVQRLYVRHIVTETKEMAEFVLQQYLKQQQQQELQENKHNNNIHNDPFAALAQQLSACSATRSEGGKIGWIERQRRHDYEILPQSVVQRLFEQKPKAGDVLIVPSSFAATTDTCNYNGHVDSDNRRCQWHTIQVMELWTELPMTKANHEDDETSAITILDGSRRPQEQQQQEMVAVVGSHGGINVVVPRRKNLKGHGVLPEVQFPQQGGTYAIQTAGCQMNVADSERLQGILQFQLNMTRSETPKEADLILFNTCSIRDHAEQKLYDAIGPFAAQKRKGRKHLALVVTGCVAQQEGEALLRRIPEIDVVLGPQYVPHLKTVLEKVTMEGSQVAMTQPMFLQQLSDDFHSKPVRGHDVRAWVNVIFGCNEHCTYCVVPATRGMEQSRSTEAILDECLDLAQQGYKEVTLLGQNIDAYGRDMVPKRTFADLLEFLNARIPGKMRIRYVTSHPRYFSDRVIDAVANLDKVCECFHVPFQAGDDQVLKTMRRGYTYKSYMRIIDKIRAQAPDASICGDVIVGFPGETEEAFQKTLELMEEVKFDNLNTFAYSPRPNTEAALWENQVPEEIKSDRLRRVQELAARHGLERSQRYLGRTVEVLVEDGNPRNPAQVMGRTRQGRQVYFDGALEDLCGHFVPVKITHARTWSLLGELVV